MVFCVLFLAGVIGITAAFPSNITEVIDANCIISSYSQVSHITSSSCHIIQINSMTVPAGKTLTLHLKTGVKVYIAGTITFAVKEWDGPLVEIKGSKVTITGIHGAKLDGLGAKYWDGKGDKGTRKPKFVKVKTTGGSTIKNVDLLNCPRQCWSIDGAASHTTLTGCDVDISAGDSDGKNTDGYDISASDIIIRNATIHNQDDCVAINKGSNIKISGLTCIGGHGLSFSVGKLSTPVSVNNVSISNCKLENSTNGIRIKTHCEAPVGGSISDVIFSNISMSGITYYGVRVQQDYSDGKSTGTAQSNVPIKGLILHNVKGTMIGSQATPVYILCGTETCSNFYWSGISITGGKKSSKCNFQPSGFHC